MCLSLVGHPLSLSDVSDVSQGVGVDSGGLHVDYLKLNREIIIATDQL